MAELTRLPGSAAAERVVAVLEDQGAVIVEGLLAPEVLARVNAEVDPHVAAATPGGTAINPLVDAFFGPATRHVSGVCGKSPTFATSVLCHPTLLGVCDALLLPGCADYQLNLAHILDRGPGAEAQMAHRDELVWPHLPSPHGTVQVASIVALVDFEPGMGATEVVPGSHQWGDARRRPTGEEWAVAEMPAGSAVVYLGSTIHRAGTNTTDRWRRGLHLSYALGWLRTEENNVLACPPSVARTLPRRALELIGYGIHDAIADGGGYLGMVDLHNPIELLGAERLPA
jgi:ectoine hydroxylase-related dioxygenase (phytanoyl-CoA dioxygenase family)